MTSAEARCFFFFGQPQHNNNTRVTYINRLQTNVEIFEILNNGQERRIGTVAPGQTTRVPTTVGRRLIARGGGQFQQADRATRNGTITLKPQTPSNRIFDPQDGPTDLIFDFPFQLSAAGGNNALVTGLVDDALSVDLSQSLTITAWLRSFDAVDWRTLVSIESPDCKTSLLNIALVPGTMSVYFAYMVDAQQRVDVVTGTVAPGPHVPFHFTFTLTSQGATVYINGRRQSYHAIQRALFNPDHKRVVIGRTKFENMGTAQWNGQISHLKVFNSLLDEGEITQEMETTRA